LPYAEGEKETTVSGTAFKTLTNTTRTVSATKWGTLKSSTISISGPVPTNFELNHADQTGGHSIAATLTMRGKAPGSYAVAIEESSSVVAGGQFSVAASATTATRTITTSAVASSTDYIKLTVSKNGKSVERNIRLHRAVVESVTFPEKVFEGSFAPGAVTLRHPAPAGGVTVTVSSSNDPLNGDQWAFSPLPLVIPAGSKTKAFLRTVPPLDVLYHDLKFKVGTGPEKKVTYYIYR